MDTTIPIWEKLTLTIKEASEYSNIGQNRIRELAKDPRNDIALFVGKKILIKRKEFEKIITRKLEL